MAIPGDSYAIAFCYDSSSYQGLYKNSTQKGATWESPGKEPPTVCGSAVLPLPVGARPLCLMWEFPRQGTKTQSPIYYHPHYQDFEKRTLFFGNPLCSVLALVGLCTGALLRSEGSLIWKLLRLLVYIHTYIYICIYIYIYLFTCIHTYIHACIHPCIHAYTAPS